MEYLEALINLGLNEKEAKAYLALLPLSRATAYMVATRSGLKKPTAHVVLDNLVSKGFALKIPYRRKHLYIAKSPQECLAAAKEKIMTAEDILPNLLAMQRKNEEKASVSYFEGMEGVKEMYEQLIKIMKDKPEEERTIVAFYAHAKDTPDVLRKYFLQLNEKQLGPNNIKRKAITTRHESIRNYLEKLTMKKFGLQMKALPESDYSSNISVEIYDNFTLIISHRYIQGILIENEDIADVMRQVFNLVWKLTKEKARP